MEGNKIKPEEVRAIINPEYRNLTVYYPGPAYDLINPLEMTDGSRYIFVDNMSDTHYGTIEERFAWMSEQIKDFGGVIHQIRELGKKKWQMDFSIRQKSREVIYYEGFDARTFMPAEMENGYDIYFSKGISGLCYPPSSFAKKIHHMKRRGLFVTSSALYGEIILKDGMPALTYPNFDLEMLGFQPLDVIHVDIKIICGNKRDKIMYCGRKNIEDFTLDFKFLKKIRSVDLNCLETCLTSTYLPVLLDDLEGLIEGNERVLKFIQSRGMTHAPNVLADLEKDWNFSLSRINSLTSPSIRDHFKLKARLNGLSERYQNLWKNFFFPS